MSTAIETEAYWQDDFSIEAEDDTRLQEHAIQIGRPMPTDEIVRLILEQRLAEAQGPRGGGDSYSPENRFDVGDHVAFPSQEGAVGEVVGLRDGRNSRYGAFKVIEVRFEGMPATREFAAELDNGSLSALVGNDRPEITFDELYERYGPLVHEKVVAALEESESFVHFGKLWLPQLMLVDFHEGHRNIAEAMIDITGEALPPAELLTEIPLQEEASDEVMHFSLNYVLSGDERFTNVGTADEPRWYLPRLG